MKVLGFIGAMTADGAERVMSLLVNTLASEGHEVVLLLQSNIIEYKLDERIKVIVVGNNGVTNPVSSFLNIYKGTRRVFKQENPDVIVSFMSVVSIYACLCSIGLHIPVIVSERNTPSHEVRTKLHSIVRNLSYRLAKGAIFQTKEARDYFPKHIRNLSTIIPNPVSDNLPYADRKNIEKTIVTLGRLDTQKNHKLLIEAFFDFSKTNPDYTLKLYGKGPLENTLKLLVHKMELEDKVLFMGNQPQIHEKIRNASMYVLSSDYEGISNALMECMAMGLPCISTDCPCGGSRELIQDGINGVLVPVRDSVKLTEAMERLADDISFANFIGANSKTVRKLYSREKIIGRYIDYIKRCARK